MNRKILITVLVLMLSLLLVACGGGDSDEPEAATAGGNAANGEELYKGTTIGSASAPGCVTCHSLEEGVTLVGPSHAGLATRAETAVSGMSAEDYLRQSIVEPDAHITEGYSAGVMYPNYGTDLPAPVVDDLVAFLLTLK